jgi:1-acyl-sn-glycerol-3-phosphate acyltransferase
MFELMRLSGQEYVDEYAAVVKLRLAGAATTDATGTQADGTTGTDTDGKDPAAG